VAQPETEAPQIDGNIVEVVVENELSRLRKVCVSELNRAFWQTGIQFGWK
jgi:hypothetical protein